MESQHTYAAGKSSQAGRGLTARATAPLMRSGYSPRGVLRNPITSESLRVVVVVVGLVLLRHVCANDGTG